MKKLWEQIKRFYDAYKIFIWVIPICGGAVYDRFVNMWNVPNRLDYDEKRFIETHTKDSIMFVNHLIHERINEIKDSLRFLEIEKQLKQKKHGNKISLVNNKANLSRGGKR